MVLFLILELRVGNHDLISDIRTTCRQSWSCFRLFELCVGNHGLISDIRTMCRQSWSYFRY